MPFSLSNNSLILLALISNKLRSSLTMLGIIIGNASVITLQLNEGVIYMGQIDEDEDIVDKYKYV